MALSDGGPDGSGWTAAADTAGDTPTVGTSAVADAPSGDAEPVWVVDGFPEYHRRTCTRTTGLDAQPIPHAQAVEDGFRECSTCTPDAA